MKPGSKLILGAVFLGIVILGWWLGIPKFVTNSEFYIPMATGHGQTVIKPFASRILHPWTVGGLIRAGVSVDAAFRAIATVVLVLLFLSIGSLVRWFGPERMIWPVLLLCPMLLEYYRTAYMNDLFHATLVGVLCLSLALAEPLVLPVLLALLLCRESTILIACVLLIYFLWRKRYGYAFGTLLTVFVGFWMLSRLVPTTSNNIHSLSTGAYIAQKTGWNFLANWVGLRLWTPSFAWACPAPLLRASVPLLNFPLVVCDWSPKPIVTTFGNLLGMLSLSTAFMLAAAKSLIARAGERRPQLLIFFAAYGILAGLVGTFTGTATNRLVGYAWPLLWIVVPVLFNSVLRSANSGWLWLHWALMWVHTAIPPGTSWLELLFCALVVGSNVWAYRRIMASSRQLESAPDVTSAVSSPA